MSLVRAGADKMSGHQDVLPPATLHQMHHPQLAYPFPQHAAGLHQGQVLQPLQQGLSQFQPHTQYFQTIPKLVVQSPSSRARMQQQQQQALTGAQLGPGSAHSQAPAAQNGRLSPDNGAPQATEAGVNGQQKQQLRTPPALPLLSVLPPQQRLLTMQQQHAQQVHAQEVQLQQWQQHQRQWQLQQQFLHQQQQQQQQQGGLPLAGAPAPVLRRQSTNSLPRPQPLPHTHSQGPHAQTQSQGPHQAAGTDTEGEQDSSRDQQQQQQPLQRPANAPLQGDVENLLQHLKDISQRGAAGLAGQNGSAKSDRTTVSAATNNSAGDEDGIGAHLPRRQRKPSVLLKNPDYDLSQQDFPKPQQVWYRANGADTALPQQEGVTGFNGYPAPVPVVPRPRAVSKAGGNGWAGPSVKRPRHASPAVAVSADAPDGMPTGVQLERLGSEGVRTDAHTHTHTHAYTIIEQETCTSCQCQSACSYVTLIWTYACAWCLVTCAG